jgi:hypothetical protein
MTLSDLDEHMEHVVLGVQEPDGVRLLRGDPIPAEQARARRGFGRLPGAPCRPVRR